jgi:hypothetical protein
MKSVFFFTCYLLVLIKVECQVFEKSVGDVRTNNDENKVQQLQGSTKGRVNFFIFTRERKGKIDLLAFYTLERARIVSLFHRRKFYIVNARSSKDAAVKVDRILQKKKKLIENLWFDSHGHYGNRYSSFLIGTDQYSYRNIRDTNSIKYLRSLSLYCDDKTKIGLGACYGGADYYFPATDSTPASRMNGDSLMMGLGDIFSKSTIYASESWVMAKPGTFTNSFGFAGWPMQKRFKDRIYAPVWERIGKWRKYSKKDGELKSISTVALDGKGDIHTRYRDYKNSHKSRKKIAKTLQSLQPGLAKL